MAQVDGMSWMFSQASAFNQDLSKWNVGKVMDMQGMFYQASAFNQDLSKWNVGQVANMEMMFNGATSFKQTLCGDAWFSSTANQGSMFIGSRGTISCDSFQPQNKNDLIAAFDTCFRL